MNLRLIFVVTSLLMGLSGCAYNYHSNIVKDTSSDDANQNAQPQSYDVDIVTMDLPKSLRKGTCRILLSNDENDVYGVSPEFLKAGISCVSKALEAMGYIVLPGYVEETDADRNPENESKSYIGTKTDKAVWDVSLFFSQLAGDTKVVYYPVYGTTGYTAHTTSIVPGESDTTIEPQQSVVGSTPVTVFDSMEWSISINAGRIKKRTKYFGRFDKGWSAEVKCKRKFNELLKDSKNLPAVMMGATLPYLKKQENGSVTVTVTDDDPNVLYLNQDESPSTIVSPNQ